MNTSNHIPMTADENIPDDWDFYMQEAIKNPEPDRPYGDAFLTEAPEGTIPITTVAGYIKMKDQAATDWDLSALFRPGEDYEDAKKLRRVEPLAPRVRALADELIDPENMKRGTTITRYGEVNHDLIARDAQRIIYCRAENITTAEFDADPVHQTIAQITYPVE